MPLRSAAGVVLVGGESQRMGVDKATLVVDGRPLVATVVEAMKDLHDVTIIGGEAEDFPGVADLWCADDFPGQGPLGGLVTGMRATDAELVVVGACDLANLSKETVAALVHASVCDGADLAVPLIGGHYQWHLGVWHRRTLPSLELLFSTGVRSLRRAAFSCRMTAVLIADSASLLDVDTPSDLYLRRPRSAPRCRQVYDQLVPIPEVAIAELVELRSAGPISLIDVREPDEYEAAHAPGAQLIPLGDIVSRSGELPDGELYVICGSGVRSMKACEALAPLGFTTTNVAGGTRGWIAAGQPVATGSGSE